MNRIKQEWKNDNNIILKYDTNLVGRVRYDIFY